MSIFTKKRKYASKDFKIENLPQTRKDQFRDLIKHRFHLLFEIGCLIVLFAIPLIFTLYFKKTFETGFYQMFSGGEISQNEYSNSILILTLIADAIYVVDFMVLSIGLAGIGRIFKQLLWGEPVYFWYDFKIGVKQNIKNYIFDAFILGLIFYICSIDIVYFGLLSIPGIALILLVLLVPLPVFLVKLSYVPIYNTNIRVSFKNSLLITLHMNLKILLWTLIFIVPCLIFLIPYSVISIIVFVFVLLLIYPIILLGYNLYIYNIFDSTINSSYYKEIYRKGLYIGNVSEKKDESL